MSPTPSPQLPDLPAEAATRLDALLAANLCIFTLAATTNTPLRDLILWADSPTIAPWLTRLRALRAARLRQELLAHLQHLARTSPDPMESRRAASAALRHLLRPRSRPRERAAPASEMNPTPHHAPAGCHWSVAARGRATSADRPPAPAPSPSERAAPASELNPTPHHPPEPPIPAPTAIPDPALTASTLAAFATPTATINNQPLIPAGDMPPRRAILASAHKPLALLATAKYTWFFAGPTFTPNANPAEHPADIPSAAPPCRTATYFQGITLADKTAHRLTLTLESRQDAASPLAWCLAALNLTPHGVRSG